MRVYTVPAEYAPLIQQALERAVRYAQLDADGRTDPQLAALSPVLPGERDDAATGDLVILVGVANDDAAVLTLTPGHAARIENAA